MVVGTITNDVRLLDTPENMSVCALRFTETARKRIEKAGGKCLTFDQLAMQSPKGRRSSGFLHGSFVVPCALLGSSSRTTSAHSLNTVVPPNTDVFPSPLLSTPFSRSPRVDAY